MENRAIQAYVHDFQPLAQPFARERAMGVTPTAAAMARGVDALAAAVTTGWKRWTPSSMDAYPSAI